MHQVFRPMVQKLLNQNFIIGNSIKSKQKQLGQLGHSAFDIVGKPSTSEKEILNFDYFCV
jgi:hypothetical protein